VADKIILIGEFQFRSLKNLVFEWKNLQFPRFYFKSIWSRFTKLGTHLPTNILQVFFFIFVNFDFFPSKKKLFLRENHLVLHFPRLHSKSIWPTFIKLGTQLPTNNLHVFFFLVNFDFVPTKKLVFEGKIFFSFTSPDLIQNLFEPCTFTKLDTAHLPANIPQD